MSIIVLYDIIIDYIFSKSHSKSRKIPFQFEQSIQLLNKQKL